MDTNILLRRLTTATMTTLSSRSLITSTPTLSPWLTKTLPRNIPKTLTRPFSQTPTTASSPFRLSNNNHTTNLNDAHDLEQDLDPSDPLSHYSQYKPKRQWPPDMSKLSQKHQFRLERKYRRRAALKFARPKWTKGTKLVQWGVIGFTLVYALLFMQWDIKGSPLDELRDTFFAGVKAMFSAPGSVKKSDRD
ncbi:uncharacterized protein EURHEDRAFT_407806 [Aspergillus ruber CBS 135680]|uniref:Uncharacterized protein n=1 Tax=Aspergillus ruber (strain CBS 135680) TaxID=1388766 RepID=A0A017SS50_ASPRC|nr:uncharacterized protein EURHEDRAFT_407806 [Aspergillus ruber CBS 135680]EYE99808.1 hypothetical protein EURHEDRAFT_407806 [Aspergillus ruber CBS 135680]